MKYIKYFPPLPEAVVTADVSVELLKSINKIKQTISMRRILPFRKVGD